MQLINYALTSNYLLGSIYVNPLDHLKLRLDFLPSPPHRENGPLLNKKDLVKADVDIPRARSDCILPTVFLTTLLMTFLIAFLYRAFLALLALDRKGAD